MQSATSTPKIIHFGHFELDLPAGRLSKRGVKVSLREKSFQVLASATAGQPNSLAQSRKTAEARAVLEHLHAIAREAYVPQTCA